MGMVRQAEINDRKLRSGLKIEESIKILSETAFRELRFKKLFGMGARKKSMHVLEKCSYNLEGAMVSEVFKNDEYIHPFVKLHRRAA